MRESRPGKHRKDRKQEAEEVKEINEKTKAASCCGCGTRGPPSHENCSHHVSSLPMSAVGLHLTRFGKLLPHQSPEKVPTPRPQRQVQRDIEQHLVSRREMPVVVVVPLPDCTEGECRRSPTQNTNEQNVSFSTFRQCAIEALDLFRRKNWTLEEWHCCLRA